MCALSDLESRLQPLLQEMLTCLRRDGEALLQSGIDSPGIVDAALTRFLADGGNEELVSLQDWSRAEAAFHRLVAHAFRDEGQTDEPADRRQDPSCRPDEIERAEPRAGDLLNETTPQRMAKWLERFHAVVHDVHPAAVEIVERRVKGATNRDIAEDLGLGLQLVKRIVGDLRTGAARIAAEG